jgi:hypothetical protein
VLWDFTAELCVVHSLPQRFHLPPMLASRWCTARHISFHCSCFDVCVCRHVETQDPGSAPLDEGVPATSAAPQFVRRATPSLVRHPDYPHLPDSVPMTYTLAMKACLSESPKDRPTFAQMQTLLGDLEEEVASGQYVNSAGALVVRAGRHCSAAATICAAVGYKGAPLPVLLCRALHVTLPNMHCHCLVAAISLPARP